MDIDANGTFNMCHAAFPELKKSGDAVVISISAYFGYGASWYQVITSPLSFLLLLIFANGC
jgi:peroxisomal 2,4-dienoyl-CoA reductase